jgi:hypothetical protein
MRGVSGVELPKVAGARELWWGDFAGGCRGLAR